ncbi:MAG: ParB N-terminal domain-containing protein [Pseudomonadota bacterium]
MAERKDKFRLVADLEPLEKKSIETRKRRGPMAEAVAETAESLDERQTERARLMEKMKSDQAAYASAVEDDRLDLMVDVTKILTTALERDRTVLDSSVDDDEMRELKASIANRGLQQSIKLFQDADGSYQLESGWRRLTAYRQLLAETGDQKFQTIRAKVAPNLEDLDAAYGRMVDENLVRKGVSHGELAVLAVRYAKADGTSAASVEDAVDKLFASAARAKRYHLRQIAILVEQVFDVLGDTSRLSRDLALKASDIVERDPEAVDALRAALMESDGKPISTNGAFMGFVTAYEQAGPTPTETLPHSPRSGREGRKIEFRSGGYKCTVKGREVRLLGPEDLIEIEEARLQRALEAFRNALDSD